MYTFILTVKYFKNIHNLKDYFYWIFKYVADECCIWTFKHILKSKKGIPVENTNLSFAVRDIEG